MLPRYRDDATYRWELATLTDKMKQSKAKMEAMREAINIL